MIEILVYLSSIATFFWIGYQTGNQMPKPKAKILPMDSGEIFKEGYIKGYTDCWAAKESDKKYYDEFPPMGTN